MRRKPQISQPYSSKYIRATWQREEISSQKAQENQPTCSSHVAFSWLDAAAVQQTVRRRGFAIYCIVKTCTFPTLGRNPSTLHMAATYFRIEHS